MAFADEIAGDVASAANTANFRQQQLLAQKADKVTSDVKQILKEALAGLERGLREAGFSGLSHEFEEKERWEVGHARSITLKLASVQTRKPLEFVFGVTQQLSKRKSEGYQLKVIGSHKTLSATDIASDGLREFVRAEIREQLRDQIDTKLLHQP